MTDRFDELLKRLQAWRDADYEGALMLTRHDIIVIIEGLKGYREEIKRMRHTIKAVSLEGR